MVQQRQRFFYTPILTPVPFLTPFSRHIKVYLSQYKL
jgi:hypothetical protein